MYKSSGFANVTSSLLKCGLWHILMQHSHSDNAAPAHVKSHQKVIITFLKGCSVATSCVFISYMLWLRRHYILVVSIHMSLFIWRCPWATYLTSNGSQQLCCKRRCASEWLMKEISTGVLQWTRSQPVLPE